MSDSTPIAPGYKRCNRGSECAHPNGPILPSTTEYFHKSGNAPTGLSYRCKACQRRYDQEHHSSQRDEILERQRHRYAENPEPHRARARRYAGEHVDRHRQTAREWNKANPQKHAEHSRRHRRKHPEKHLNLKRIWRAANPDKVHLMFQRRRTRKLDLPNSFGDADLRRMMDYWHDQCCICGSPAGMWHLLTLEHWIALSDPRADNPGTVPWNIVPMCHTKKGAPLGKPSCNLSKSNKDPVEWLTQRFGKRKAMKKLNEINAYFTWVTQQQSS